MAAVFIPAQTIWFISVQGGLNLAVQFLGAPGTSGIIKQESGVGKITLYKGKEVMKRNIDSVVAVDELIQLLKEHNVWIAPQ